MKKVRVLAISLSHGQSLITFSKVGKRMERRIQTNISHNRPEPKSLMCKIERNMELRLTHLETLRKLDKYSSSKSSGVL